MILDAFKFTNNLFSNHFSKFLSVVFPVYVIIFFVYLQMSSIPGNEFGTTTAFNYQELVTNLLSMYAVILSILLIDDICNGRKRSIINYLFLGAYLYFKILVINLITALAIVLGLVLLILPGLYISARLLFASYLAIIFDEGIVDSLKKSIELTKGKGWRVLGYLFAVVVPLIFILILVLSGPAVFLSEKNMNAYIALTFSFSFLFTVYITIYSYRLLINITKTSDELN